MKKKKKMPKRHAAQDKTPFRFSLCNGYQKRNELLVTIEIIGVEPLDLPAYLTYYLVIRYRDTSS